MPNLKLLAASGGESSRRGFGSFIDSLADPGSKFQTFGETLVLVIGYWKLIDILELIFGI